MRLLFAIPSHDYDGAVALSMKHAGIILQGERRQCQDVKLAYFAMVSAKVNLHCLAQRTKVADQVIYDTSTACR